MDAFLNFLLQTNKYGRRLFISEAPGPVFLIWGDFESAHKIAGITLVRKENSYTKIGIDYRRVLEIIRSKLGDNFPILEVVYNDNVTSFNIDGENYNNEQAARLISEKLSIKLGKNPAKRPNDPAQISDAFHKWSRDVFDGISVKKADIDAMLLNDSGDDISAIIEIKRSARKPIGQWTPYMTDYWNYFIGITFSKMVEANFQTFHHELMAAEEVFNDETQVEIFEFRVPAIVSKETIEAFASKANRKILTGKDFYK